MPKHFSNAPQGKHFAETDADARPDATQPQEGANETTAKTGATIDAQGKVLEAPDLGETRPMSPDVLPTADAARKASPDANADERTRLLESVPPIPAGGTNEALADELPDPADTGDATIALAREAAAPTETPKAQAPSDEAARAVPSPHAEPTRREPLPASPEDGPIREDASATTLGRHEVAAVQTNDQLYMRSEPSPYLSNRQAAADPKKARHRHTVLIATLLVLVALAAVGGAAYYIYRAMQPTVQTTDVQFETDKITRGNFYDTLDATASLEPLDTADVIPQVTGTIKSLAVEDGSSVTKGDVLFTMDNPTITAATSTAKSELDDAQSDLDDKNSQLEDANDKLSELRDALSQSASTIYSLVGATPASTTFNVDTDGDGTPDALDVDGDGKADGYDTNGDGIVDMVDTNGDGVPDVFDTNGDGKVDATTDLPSSLTAEQRAALSAAESSYQSSQGQIESARSAVDSATAAVKNSEENVSNLQDAYDRAVAQEKKLTVTAPISGVVHNLSSSLVEGGSISTTSKLCEIDDVSSYVFTIQASETKAHKTKVGQTATLTFPDIDGLTATGTVTSVATSRTEGANTFAVDIRLDNPDGQLSIGTNTNASIVLQEIDDVLLVPSAALSTTGHDSYLDILLDPVRGIDTQVQVNVVADNGETAVVEADNIQEGNAVILSKSTSSD